MTQPIQYVDKTGTVDKPNPMRDVYLEFPKAMRELAIVTVFGAKKHAPRGWQTFEPKYGLDYHMSKVGRHLLDREEHGSINHSDGDLRHLAQAAWNLLAALENELKLRDNDAIAAKFQRGIDRGPEAFGHPGRDPEPMRGETDVGMEEPARSPRVGAKQSPQA